eukprot:201749_1
MNVIVAKTVDAFVPWSRLMFGPLQLKVFIDLSQVTIRSPTRFQSHFVSFFIEISTLTRMILVCIFVTYMICSTQAITTITNTWTDDFAFDSASGAVGLSGWHIYNFQSLTQSVYYTPDPNPVIHSNEGTQYHGPFTRISESRSNYLRRRFECSRDTNYTHIYIQYSMAFCATDGTDYTKLCQLNSDIGVNENNADICSTDKAAVDFMNLRSHTLKDDVFGNISAECTPWYYSQRSVMFTIGAPWDTHDTFDITLKQAVGNYEYSLLYDISISCSAEALAMPSRGPTLSPITLSPTTRDPTTPLPTTSNPTTTPPITSAPITKSPTSSPITAFPTSNPTSAPVTTSVPTTSLPTTLLTTSAPTTAFPTTSIPTTSHPTTAYPTTTPIALCNVDNAVYAEWSPSHLGIRIHIPNRYDKRRTAIDTIMMKDKQWINDCSYVFAEETVDLLGTDATCHWIRTKKESRLRALDEDIVLVIELSPDSTLYYNHSITFANGEAIQYVCAADEEYSDNAVLSSIHAPVNDGYAPLIMLSSSSSSIGICDDLILDARSTTFLGGRDAIFEWEIERTYKRRRYSNYYFGSYVVIANALLDKLTMYNITLSVTNWYNVTSSITFDVEVANKVQPKVSLSGTHVYKATRIHLDGYIDAHASIDTNRKCAAAVNAQPVQYNLSWSVNAQKLYDDSTVIDTALLAEFNRHLSDTHMDMEHVSVFVDDWMQSGLEYEFRIRLQCTDMDYACDIDAVHDLRYYYSRLKCRIFGNGIALSEVDPVLDELYDVTLQMDGKRLTFDPDIRQYKKHLAWNWTCFNPSLNESCSELIELDTSSVIDVDLGIIAWNYSSSYSFEFTMEVHDTTNVGRDSCMDTITLYINTTTQPLASAPITTNIPLTSTQTLAPEDTQRIKLFIVEAVAIQERIRVHDRLNIMGTIPNYKDEEYMYFEWFELNGLLNQTEMNEYKETLHDNSMHLVLKQNVLRENEIYSFKLVVRQYESPLSDRLIGYGESEPVDILVLHTPEIHQNSFVIQPPCVRTYQSISDVLLTTYSLTISGDDDDGTLSYQFEYTDDSDVVYPFHPLPLSESTLNDIYLPFTGHFTLLGHVVNAESSVSTEYIDCSIVLLNHSQCIIHWKRDVIDTYTHDNQDDDDKYQYIFSQINAYLHYLHDDYVVNDSDLCIEQSIAQILDTLDEHIAHETCSISKWMVFLSTTMTVLLDLIDTADALRDTFYNEYLSTIQNLLSVTLDPCECIANLDSVQSLYLIEQSIYTQIPSVYYYGDDIMWCLSPIISDEDHHHLLHALPIKDLSVDAPSNESIDLHNLWLDAIYITELVAISTTIAGTQICSDTSCTLRIDSEMDQNNITVDIGNTTVYIPHHITSDDQVTDIVVVTTGSGMFVNDDPQAATMAVVLPKDQYKCGATHYLVDNILLIDIKIESNETVLPSLLSHNIRFKTPCNGACNESFECVWFNKHDETWQNDGCRTTINYNANETDCECSLIATFGIKYTIDNTCDDSFVSKTQPSNAWDILIWLIFAAFIWIFVHSMCAIFCHRNKYVMGLMGITALLYAITCVLAYFVQHSSSNPDPLLLQTYSLCLLFPQLTYYMMFTLIFYLCSYKQTRLTIALFIINIINISIFAYCALSLHVNHIFVIGAVVWCVIVIATTLLILIYSIRFYQSLSAPHHHRHVHPYLGMYLVCLAIVSIYLSLDPAKHLTHTFVIIYYCISILFLCFVLLCYRDCEHNTNSKILKDRQSIQMASDDRYTFHTEVCVAPKGEDTAPNGIETSAPTMIISSNAKETKTIPHVPFPPMSNRASTPTVTEPNSKVMTPQMHFLSVSNQTSLRKKRACLKTFSSAPNVLTDNHEIEASSPQTPLLSAESSIAMAYSPQMHEKIEFEELGIENAVASNTRNTVITLESVYDSVHDPNPLPINEFVNTPQDDEQGTLVLVDYLSQSPLSEGSNKPNEDTQSAQTLENIDEKNALQEQQTIGDLLGMELSDSLKQSFGDPSKYKLATNAKERELIERDVRKLLMSNDKYTKLAVLKHYDILMETFIRYCKIGQDTDWLTMKGWDALCADAFISNKTTCTPPQCHEVFNIVYAKHNPLQDRQQRTHKAKMSTQMVLSEWNEVDPWSGTWQHEDDDNDETFTFKQIGDKKLVGFIKSFEFCDMNGSLKPGSNKTKANMMISWHLGARKNKRRLCKCSLMKPTTNSGGPIKMMIEWKEIAISSIVDQIQQEKGVYILVKMEELSHEKDASFKYQIGLARHEYIDAMLVVSQMRYDADARSKYETLTKLCDNHLIPFIWNGSEGAQEATIKSLFRPYSTELHKLFAKYNDIYSGNLLCVDAWTVLCNDIFKYGPRDLKDAKPSANDIASSFELAKEGHDLELNYKGFEKALQMLASKIYKKQPRAKYKTDIKYQEKLKALLKWSVKLQKSGYQPTVASNK